MSQPHLILTLNNRWMTPFHHFVSRLFTPNLCFADAEQCKYGKNRVEADAKRLQAKEEELMKKKQEIRNHLTQLKKDRRDLRTAVEAAAGEREREGFSVEKLLVIQGDMSEI